LWVQGAYFLVTGLWPLVSVDTFQMVTGQKTDHRGTEHGDHWLVITVGVLVIAIAAPLHLAAWQRVLHSPTVVLAIASAIGLTAIDVIYVCRGAIPPIYLLDAGIEVLVLACWAVTLIGRRSVPHRHPQANAGVANDAGNFEAPVRVARS